MEQRKDAEHASLPLLLSLLSFWVTEGTEHLEERLNYRVSDPLGMNRPKNKQKNPTVLKREKKIRNDSIKFPI